MFSRQYEKINLSNNNDFINAQFLKSAQVREYVNINSLESP